MTTTEPSAVPKSLDFAGPIRPSTISRNCTSRALKSLTSTKPPTTPRASSRRQVAAVPGDDDPDLQLVVQGLGVRWPAHGVSVADERRRVPLVIQRLLVPQRARTQPRERAARQPLEAVAHHPRGRFAQPQQTAAHGDHVLLPQRAVTKRQRTERRSQQRRRLRPAAPPKPAPPRARGPARPHRGTPADLPRRAPADPHPEPSAAAPSRPSRPTATLGSPAAVPTIPTRIATSPAVPAIPLMVPEPHAVPPAALPLAARQERGPYGGWWLLPGGKVEFGEPVAEAARREAAEESGCEVGDLVLTGVYEILGPGHHFVMCPAARTPRSRCPAGPAGTGHGTTARPVAAGTRASGRRPGS